MKQINQIDERVKNIFNNILERRYTLVAYRYGVFTFKAGERDIVLHVNYKRASYRTTNDAITLDIDVPFTTHFLPWDGLCKISEEYKRIEGYSFSIVIENKDYAVPPIGRVAEAKAIDILENMIQDWEMQYLLDVETSVNN